MNLIVFKKFFSVVFQSVSPITLFIHVSNAGKKKLAPLLNLLNLADFCPKPAQARLNLFRLPDNQFAAGRQGGACHKSVGEPD